MPGNTSSRISPRGGESAAQSPDPAIGTSLRILITSGIYPPDIGGPATYVPLMASQLRLRGHDVRVLTTAETGGSVASTAADVGVERVARRPVLLRYARFLSRAYAHACHVDVLLANGMFEEAIAAARLAGKPVAVKFVGDEAWERSVRKGWTVANLDEFQLERGSIAVRLLKAVRSMSARAADRVIVPSRYLEGVVRGWGAPVNRCRVVYNAVPAHEARHAMRPVSSEYRILTVGRLVPWKGVDLLILALRGIEDARLTVVGDGPERQALTDLARTTGVEDRVVFVGQLPPQQLRELMQGQDVFVLASTYEGLPHIVLEAMQEGLPVIATNVGGTPEVVRPGVSGLLVSPKVEELSEAIGALRRDRALARALISGANNLLSGQFSVSRMVAETEAVLRDAIAEHRARGSRSLRNVA